MTERKPQPGMTPPGWPSSERMAAIMEAIRRGVERYREEMERNGKREPAEQ